MRETETIEYWKNVGIIVPTKANLITYQNSDVRLEAIVVDSSLIMPQERVTSPEDLEPNQLEISLITPDGFKMLAYFLISGFMKGIGDLCTSDRNIAVAKLLDQRIKESLAKGEVFGLFGGKVNLAAPLLRGSRRPALQLGYAEVPKGSGSEYLLNRAAPFSLPK